MNQQQPVTGQTSTTVATYTKKEVFMDKISRRSHGEACAGLGSSGSPLRFFANDVILLASVCSQVCNRPGSPL
ncbi:hypothetical protein CHARACLAT_012333 [Characodon lateralis]|uniref:Uncharacterized protein n=1 Tax=Characodon lateralis TaxID=208331 RepID=A0ABU7CR28_9TELE|nr:hypothetical protein [Characodon lateralis]